MPTAYRAGFLRDTATDVIQVTTSTAGATYQGGFLRAPTGELVVTTTPSAPSVKGGFLRDSNGALVVNNGGSGTVQGGWLRDATGAIVVGTGAATQSGGFGRDISGRLIVAGLVAGVAVSNQWTGAAAPGTDVVITTGGVPQGQVMYAAIADRGANTDTITPPGGWTIVLEQARGSVGKLGVYRKVAGASEPASYTFACSVSNTQVGTIIAVTGANTTTPEDATAVGSTATVATGLHTSPSITTVTAGALIMRVIATAVGALPISWTWPVSAEIVDSSSVATGAGGVTAATSVQAVAGASATEDATFAQAASTTFAAVTVAVRPA